MSGRSRNAARDGDEVEAQVNEHGWWVLRAVEGDFGGKIVVDATGEMVGPDLIDVAIQAHQRLNAALDLIDFGADRG